MSDTEEKDLTEGLETETETETETEQTETEENKADIPEGFDENLYDTEAKTLRLDKVKERFDTDKQEIEKYKKQSLDLRRKLSKGVKVPEKAEEYEYTPEEKYDRYLLDEDSIEGQHIKAVMDKLSEFSLDNGLNLEQSKSLKSLALQYMEDVKILDTRSDEEIEKSKEQELEKQKKILGDDFKDIVKGNVEFYKERGPFNSEERKYLMSAIKNSGHANNILMKFRTMLESNMSYDLPDSSTDTNVEALRNEYMNEKTTDSRREQIIRQSIQEGWKL